MKDNETIRVVESINLNPTLDASTKLDLVRKVMNDCREKQVGKILIEAIEKKTQKIREETIKPKKRGRGRPRKDEAPLNDITEKTLSPNAQKMIDAAKASRDNYEI